MWKVLMSLLQIKRGEGGTLEVSISDTAALCSRTERCVWKEMWALGSDGGCAVILWFGERKDERSGSNQKCLCLCAYADIHSTLANSYRWTQACHERHSMAQETSERWGRRPVYFTLSVLHTQKSGHK